MEIVAAGSRVEVVGLSSEKQVEEEHGGRSHDGWGLCSSLLVKGGFLEVSLKLQLQVMLCYQCVWGFDYNAGNEKKGK